MVRVSVFRSWKYGAFENFAVFCCDFDDAADSSVCFSESTQYFSMIAFQLRIRHEFSWSPRVSGLSYSSVQDLRDVGSIAGIAESRVVVLCAEGAYHDHLVAIMFIVRDPFRFRDQFRTVTVMLES